MKKIHSVLWSGALVAAGWGDMRPALSQGVSEESGLEEIVVSARRKEENVQDVPATVNAVTGEDIQKLNILRFEDLTSVIPGLTLGDDPNGLGFTASVRGVNYDVNASGSNGTVEFYLNDAPLPLGDLFQSMYDVQQVELLRGPQGTLRGRAAPSGSMTVTTRTPDLNEFGGTFDATFSNYDATNFRGAVNLPVIPGMLAVRIAGLFDENEGNLVRSLNDPEKPETRSDSGRVSVRFDPLSNLSFLVTAQTAKRDTVTYDQVESEQLVEPAAPLNPGLPGGSYTAAFITPAERLSLEVAPRTVSQYVDTYNLQVKWDFAGQQLNYVGAWNDDRFREFEPSDVGGYFPPNYPAFTQGFGEPSDVDGQTYSQEVRLSNTARIAGLFDYVLGGFYQKSDAKAGFSAPTLILYGPPSPTVGGSVNLTPITNREVDHEKSFFANVTLHLGDNNELSGGARYIKYDEYSNLAIGGMPLGPQLSDANYTIFNVSAKHNFSKDLMAYATVGSSWRPGRDAVGDFNSERSPLEDYFLDLPAEKSISYELGVKAEFLDNRLRTSLDVYHQKFDNYQYRSSSGVFYAETFFPGFATVGQYNFVAPVPVVVNGVEGDIAFSPDPRWDIDLSASIAQSEIKNGLIPCNDYFPRDGIPDVSPNVPTVAQIVADTGGGTVSGCNVTYRATFAPQWGATLQSEYRVPISSALTGYLRGLLSLYGSSKNDPTNPLDDYSAYAILNLYLGVRGRSSPWEVSLFAKNVTNTERVLSLSSTPLVTTYNIGAASQNGLTNYYGGTGTSGIVMTPPREFGINMHYAFGSR